MESVLQDEGREAEWRVEVSTEHGAQKRLHTQC